MPERSVFQGSAELRRFPRPDIHQRPPLAEPGQISLDRAGHHFQREYYPIGAHLSESRGRKASGLFHEKAAGLQLAMADLWVIVETPARQQARRQKEACEQLVAMANKRP